MDIRNTALLDDFSSQGAEDSSGTFPIDPVTSPWFTSPGSNPVDISSGGLGGSAFPPVSCLGFYSGRAFLGENIETWGIAEGSAALSDAWRFGLYTVASIAVGAPDGYQGLAGQGVSGNFWLLRRYDGGVATDIAQFGPPAALPGGGDIVLIKRNGDDVEIWWSVDAGANWTLMVSTTDITYTTGPWFFVYGTTGVETGWSAIGGGIKNRQHIYRWLRGNAPV